MVHKKEQKHAQMVQWHLQVGGVVQGVGFRPFVAKLAKECGILGAIANTTEGVVVDAFGQEAVLTQFVYRLQQDAPRLAHINSLQIEKQTCVQMAPEGFEILASQLGNGRTYVSPDVAVCDACLSELFAAKDRRFLYPFINCTNCGPRFSIIQSIPYDRPNTTMADFEMCPECKQEYKDANDRRYHAQPVACPNCGPHIWFEDMAHHQTVFGARALDDAVARLQRGEILAIRGLGGFHIACLAKHEEAIGRLRASKLRPSKPLAVMVPSNEAASEIVWGNDLELQVLSDAEAPIVLMRQRPGGVPEGISPQNAYVGVMLPYTPLHHLLLKALDAPLVMTSGNVRGAPICKDNEEAKQALGDFVDGFIFHNRPIERRCDDSVVMVCEMGRQTHMQPVRRSRGFAPLPVMLPKALTLTHPVLATGGDLKNVSAIATDNQVFLSAHIGDLTHLDARREQRQALADLQRLFDIEPACVVADMHPLYASTDCAKHIQNGRPLVLVQHHHAHIASCMVDAGVEAGDVIGLAFDGTGYGTDGHIWGGEVLQCGWADFERLYHLEYMPLPGGDAATSKPYRIALAYVMALCPEADMGAIFPSILSSEIELIKNMITHKINTPLTSSMGRLFDAVAALLNLCVSVEHEAQAAMALEAQALAWTDQVEAYPVAFEDENICLQPLLQALLADIGRAEPAAYIARRFHQTVAHMAGAAACKIRDRCGLNRVALSGGVWQNRLLLKMAIELLSGQGFEVLTHRNVPANDGGIALGQVAVVAAKMKEAGYVFGGSG